MLKTLVAVGLLIFTNQASAKSKCEQEWKALKNVQSQMRNRSTERLRDQERYRHNEYQTCRKGKKKKSKSYKAKTNYKNQKTTYKKNSYPKYLNKNITNSVSLKGKFKDEKQDAWIQYYDKPQECILPKSIQEFSKCLNDRDEKSKKFDKEWNNK